jgi:hypothetical protein
MLVPVATMHVGGTARVALEGGRDGEAIALNVIAPADRVGCRHGAGWETLKRRAFCGVLSCKHGPCPSALRLIPLLWGGPTCREGGDDDYRERETHHRFVQHAVFKPGHRQVRADG